MVNPMQASVAEELRMADPDQLGAIKQRLPDWPESTSIRNGPAYALRRDGP
jgi:hypothetical protein